jgi:RNA-directed DNA polymerase
LAKGLFINGKSKPTRRIWIPKPGKTEFRPLSIPTIFDRALQAVVKATLEPEWEARFEPSSYGFRPGRSCHDAIKHIKNCIVSKSKFVLDADISHIPHPKMLQREITEMKIEGSIKTNR